MRLKLRPELAAEAQNTRDPNGPYGLCACKAALNASWSEFRSSVKVEVDVLGSPSLIVRTVSVDVKLQ